MRQSLSSGLAIFFGFFSAKSVDNRAAMHYDGDMSSILQVPIGDELKERLRRLAEQDLRSLAKEALYCIEREVQRREADLSAKMG